MRGNAEQSTEERNGAGEKEQQRARKKKGCTPANTAGQSRQGRIIWRSGLEHPGQSGAQPPDWIVRGSGPSATDWNIRGQEATKQQGSLDWSIREEEETKRQAQGAWTGASGEERADWQQGPPDWNIRGAETLDGNNRRRSE